MPSIKIERNVPLPVSSDVPSLPLEQMLVGESFVLKLNSDTDKSTVRQRVGRFQRNNPPKRFSVRMVENKSLRVFRVNDYK